jgi:integrase/recombinase XerD
MELTEYLKNKYSPKTVIIYQKEITVYLSTHPNAQQYSHTEIIQYIGQLRTRYKNPKTINRILASIKAYYNFLFYSKQRKDNPSKSIKLRDRYNRDIQLQDLFSTKELESLLKAKTERYKNLVSRNQVLISLLIYQALKPSEIEALEIQDVNFEEATILVKPSPKSHGRHLPLKTSQILLIKNYIDIDRKKLLKKNSEVTKLMIGQRGKAVLAEDITKHIKRSYGNIYKPRKVSAVTIRQSVIRNLLKDKKDLRLVQSFAGHKSTTTTEQYKQNNVEALQLALELHHPFK